MPRPRIDLESELAEREDWLDRLPEEIDRAVGFLREEWIRLGARESELLARLGELEAELERLRRSRGFFRRLRDRWVGR